MKIKIREQPLSVGSNLFSHKDYYHCTLKLFQDHFRSISLHAPQVNCSTAQAHCIPRFHIYITVKSKVSISLFAVCSRCYYCLCFYFPAGGQLLQLCSVRLSVSYFLWSPFTHYNVGCSICGTDLCVSDHMKKTLLGHSDYDYKTLQSKLLNLKS